MIEFIDYEKRLTCEEHSLTVEEVVNILKNE